MIYKNTIFSGYEDGQSRILPLEMHDLTLLKSASELHPEIERYIKNVKPIPNKNILLIDALGAGEYWGANLRGDYFEEAELDRPDENVGYKSFMQYAYPYLEHRNEGRKKDPSRRFGEKVVLSVYNKPMHRVQLIVIVDSNKDPIKDVVSRIDAGMHPDVSMACHVAYDKCSICGSRHRTLKDYCVHARNQLKEILPDGRKVFLYNYNPKFHDISFVFMGADRSAKVLQKIANVDQSYGYNSDYGILLPNYYTTHIKSKEAKQATIEKQIKLNSPAIAAVTKNGKKKSVSAIKAKISQIRAKLNKEIPYSKTLLKKVAAADTDFNNILYEATKQGFYFKPEEFQYLYLTHNDQNELAEQLAKEGKVFEPLLYDKDFDGDLFKNATGNKYVGILLNTYHYERSGETIDDRSADLDKKAFGFLKPNSIVWPTLSGLYRAYNKTVPKLVKSLSSKLERHAPLISSAASLGAATAVNQYANNIWLNNPAFDASPGDISLSMTGNEIIKYSSIDPQSVYLLACVNHYGKVNI